jgi:hypothetical protein
MRCRKFWSEMVYVVERAPRGWRASHATATNGSVDHGFEPLSTSETVEVDADFRIPRRFDASLPIQDAWPRGTRSVRPGWSRSVGRHRDLILDRSTNKPISPSRIVVFAQILRRERQVIRANGVCRAQHRPSERLETPKTAIRQPVGRRYVPRPKRNVSRAPSLSRFPHLSHDCFSYQLDGAAYRDSHFLRVMKIIRQLINLDEHQSNEAVVKAVQDALAELSKNGTLLSSEDMKGEDVSSSERVETSSS